MFMFLPLYIYTTTKSYYHTTSIFAITFLACLVQNIYMCLNFTMFKLIRFLPKPKYKLDYFCVALVTHCNLNCRYCDHFSPLAKEQIYSVNKITKDFKRISKFFNVHNIGLMGGEPLLHPDLSKIIENTAKIFPSTNLIIFTNGILLNKMDENFWRICRTNRVIIRITKYDINIDLNKIIYKAHSQAVRIEIDGNKNNSHKTMHKIKLDLSGTQNPDDMFQACWHRKICTYFEDGKFYLCPIAGNIRHFNSFFNKNLNLAQSDFLDVYKLINIDEIEQYFSSTMKFCKYCKITEQENNLPFEISKREMNDWC